MIKLIVLGLAAVAVLVLAYAWTRPAAFRISRSIRIAAPPEKIAPFIADFRAWPAWSPWEGKDPAMKRTLSGPESGVGAVYVWEGNKAVGSGRMEILEATRERILVDLEFLAPMAARNKAEFLLVEKDGGTDATWSMSGPSPFMHRLMGLFMNFDKMVGGEFEKGLAALKAAAEK